MSFPIHRSDCEVIEAELQFLSSRRFGRCRSKSADSYAGACCRDSLQEVSAISLNREIFHKNLCFCVLTSRTIDVLRQTHSTDEEMFSTSTFSGHIEFSPSFGARPQVSHVVFDFDGTIAWLKHGWPDIMAKVLLPYFPNPTDETLHNLRAEILALNGKPPIFQIRRCLEMVSSGEKLPEAELLLKEYASRLGET